MISYECEKRRNVHECKAKVTVLAGETVGRTNQHTYPPDSRLVDVAKTKAGVNRQAEDTLETPQQIIDNIDHVHPCPSAEQYAAYDRGTVHLPGHFHRMPATSVSQICWQRAVAVNSFWHLIPGKALKTVYILIYATTRNLNLLRNSDSWLAGGTFQTVPELFYHAAIYGIHVLKNGYTLPCVYALLPNN